MTSDIEYCRARSIEERERAAAASEQYIANIHLDLAAKYEALAKEAGAESTTLPLWDWCKAQSA